MSKMSFCLTAIKTLHPSDLDALTTSIEHYTKAGMPTEQAEHAAGADLLADIASDRKETIGMLKEQHPDAFKPTQAAETNADRGSSRHARDSHSRCVPADARMTASRRGSRRPSG